MKTILSILSIAMVALACGSNKTEGSNATENTLPGVNTVNQAQTQTSDSLTGNTGALNPAHGEPGHRCDIPVGSPLNSKPAEQPATNNTQPVQPTVISPSPTTIQPAGKTTTAAGLNPAHGEPGHRCDIPVGSPLNSKPTQTTTTQNTFIPPTAPKKAN